MKRRGKWWYSILRTEKRKEGERGRERDRERERERERESSQGVTDGAVHIP